MMGPYWMALINVIALILLFATVIFYKYIFPKNNVLSKKSDMIYIFKLNSVYLFQIVTIFA